MNGYGQVHKDLNRKKLGEEFIRRRNIL